MLKTASVLNWSVAETKGLQLLNCRVKENLLLTGEKWNVHHSDSSEGRRHQ